MSSSSPSRRPANRSRLKANAAATPLNSAAKALMKAIAKVLRNQIANGYWSLWSRLVKLSKEDFVGKMQLSAAKPAGPAGRRR